MKSFVQNPLLGEGLVAGYGPSKGGYRPGFAWFFGRDSFWTSFALTAAGDFDDARAPSSSWPSSSGTTARFRMRSRKALALMPWFRDLSLWICFRRCYAAVHYRGSRLCGGERRCGASHASMRQRLWKALEFMRSTFDEDGFPRNLGVGHGWVEGGPLLPVRMEFYQAGIYVESLRSLAWLARVSERWSPRPIAGCRSSDAKRRSLERLFWLRTGAAFAFGRPAGP